LPLKAPKANKAECCRAATLPLHTAANPRMYKGLTVKTPGCVAFSLPVQRRNFRYLGASSVFPIPPRPAQRAADKERRFPARAASGPRLPSCSRDGFRNGIAGYPAARRRYAVAGERLGATPGLQRQTRRRFCRQCVQTGRRLMRQTVLPTIPGKIAPRRSESSARRFAPGSRSAGRPGLRFGLPLTPESGGPSRHPAAPYALAAVRARRRQEFQNAQQNVDRCHPPGRDPGRCGPRQPSRRI
jgi:hypothetical protein